MFIDKLKVLHLMPDATTEAENDEQTQIILNGAITND